MHGILLGGTRECHVFDQEGGAMKECQRCEVMIPDHTHHCPHCRKRQPRGEWQLQAVLLSALLVAAVSVLAETC